MAETEQIDAHDKVMDLINRLEAVAFGFDDAGKWKEAQTQYMRATLAGVRELLLMAEEADLRAQEARVREAETKLMLVRIMDALGIIDGENDFDA